MRLSRRRPQLCMRLTGHHYRTALCQLAAKGLITPTYGFTDVFAMFARRPAKATASKVLGEGLAALAEA